MGLKRAVFCCWGCLLLLRALAGCGAGGGGQTTTAPSATTTAATGRLTVAENPSTSLQVSSPAFESGGTIPTKYTGEGEGISPPLTWSGLPERTRELALVCDDPDAPRSEPFVHWVVYKIPADPKGLPEGSTQGALEGENSAGRVGYTGPMPPQGGGIHHYHFKVYALDTELDVGTGLTKDQLLEAMEGHILAEGELIGTYERE
jgi:Raf kinase inhibitor-like YbhB/YbcL family protein